MASPAQEKVALDRNPMRYGVELQFVFVFEESYLRPWLGGLSKVAKNIPYEARAYLPFNAGGRDDTVYNSWGIVDVLEKYPRQYRVEPLRIVREILQRVVEPIDIKMWSEDTKEVHAGRYKTWHITNERSLPGVGPAFLESYVQDRMKPWTENWDSWGIRVVTPLLNTDNNSHLDQIMRVIDVLSKPDTDKFDVLVGNSTGLHVHVEAPRDFAVLKELAFITIIYEEELSRIHPPCRRPGHALANGFLETNREVFLRDVNAWAEPQLGTHLGPKTLEDFLKDEKAEDKPSAPEQVSEERLARRRGVELPKLVPVSTIREKIEACKDESELSNLMGCFVGDIPQYLVNWSFLIYISKYQGRTIEFRQHRGTFDKDDIRWWIQFVTGLVRVADLYYRQGGCPVRSWADQINVFDLMHSMELPQEGIDFYYMKIASYMNYPSGGLLDRIGWDPRLVETYKCQEMVKRLTTDDSKFGENRSGDDNSSTLSPKIQIREDNDKVELTAEDPQTGKIGRKRSVDDIPSTRSPKRLKFRESKFIDDNYV
jgi:Putative amidoligase enzyme